ncbi:hypothetical protein AWZ03_003825 [Drosophila navojoa]|uniref:EF-hand domain-containing protein n=2 Tax=Drosophila navojoa TaxID=7232 RepID=A0A484BM21_DRONA|nr:hypothetical protein AWZ03_003825 [Drosophila navojoa]
MNLMLENFKNLLLLKAEASHGSSHSHFRSPTIRDYENQLRSYSTHKKIFCYFATIKVRSNAGKWIVYMTPKDFVRSMSPSWMQPEGLGLNNFFIMHKDSVQQLSIRGVSRDSVFYKLRPDGMLTYSDFLYLLRLVVLPERYFEMGFELLDGEGKQMLDKNDLSLLLFGASDGRMRLETSVKHYLFGGDPDQKLSLDSLLRFKRQLFQDIIQIEFNALKRKSRKTQDETSDRSAIRISELRFANLLLAYARMPRHRKRAILQRTYARYEHNRPGVTFEEFLSFFTFLQHLPVIQTALSYHILAGAGVSRRTFKRISDVIVGVPLSAHLIDIVFTVFADEQTGLLCHTDFIDMARQRISRCTRRSFKLARVLKSVYRCAEQTLLRYPQSKRYC